MEYTETLKNNTLARDLAEIKSENMRDYIEDARTGGLLAGDASELLEREREVVLNMGQNWLGKNFANGVPRLASSLPLGEEEVECIYKARENLLELVQDSERVQNNFGWNFFVQLYNSFLSREKIPLWAWTFDKLVVQAKTGFSIEQMISNRKNIKVLDKILINILEDDKYVALTSYMLAERSVFLQKYQEEHYGSYLQKAKKREIFRLKSMQGSNDPQIKKLKLKDETIDRVIEQIDIASFAALDHLLGGVTFEEQKGVMATFQASKIKIYYKGRLPNPEHFSPKEIEMNVQHELTHATQGFGYNRSLDKSKSGLMVCNYKDNSTQGFLLKEGMTQLIGEVAAGDFSRINELDMGYLISTHALQEMFCKEREKFACLYKAYYGEIDDVNELDRAVKTYDKYFEFVLNNPYILSYREAKQ